MTKIYRILDLSKIKEPQVVGGIKKFDYVNHTFFALFEGELPAGNEDALSLVDYENESAIRTEILALVTSTQDARLTAIAKIPSIKDAKTWRIKDIEKLCEKEREFFGSSYPNKVAGYAQKLVLAKEVIARNKVGEDSSDLLEFFKIEAAFREIAELDVVTMVITISNIVAQARDIIDNCERECISILSDIELASNDSEFVRITNAFSECDNLIIKLTEDLKELKIARHA